MAIHKDKLRDIIIVGSKADCMDDTSSISSQRLSVMQNR